jgi:hypothetical protein
MTKAALTVVGLLPEVCVVSFADKYFFCGNPRPVCRFVCLNMYATMRTQALRDPGPHVCMVKCLTCVVPREHSINFQRGRLLKLSLLERATAGLQLRKQYIFFMVLVDSRNLCRGLDRIFSARSWLKSKARKFYGRPIAI